MSLIKRKISFYLHYNRSQQYTKNLVNKYIIQKRDFEKQLHEVKNKKMSND